MVVFVHKNFLGDRRAVGMSMIVGSMIFNIVGGLGCVGDLNHEFVWRQLVWLGRLLLHMQRMLV